MARGRTLDSLSSLKNVRQRRLVDRATEAARERDAAERRMLEAASDRARAEEGLRSETRREQDRLAGGEARVADLAQAERHRAGERERIAVKRSAERAARTAAASAREAAADARQELTRATAEASALGAMRAALAHEERRDEESSRDEEALESWQASRRDGKQ